LKAKCAVTFADDQQEELSIGEAVLTPMVQCSVHSIVLYQIDAEEELSKKMKGIGRPVV
jgi:hypothetical protein